EVEPDGTLRRPGGARGGVEGQVRLRLGRVPHQLHRVRLEVAEAEHVHRRGEREGAGRIQVAAGAGVERDGDGFAGHDAPAPRRATGARIATRRLATEWGVT